MRTTRTNVIYQDDEFGALRRVARSVDRHTGIGAEVTRYDRLPHQPTLELTLDGDLYHIGGTDTGIVCEIRDPDAVRVLAAALIAVADQADARRVFNALRARCAMDADPD
jgi:hypothetical protein